MELWAAAKAVSSVCKNLVTSTAAVDDDDNIDGSHDSHRRTTTTRGRGVERVGDVMSKQTTECWFVVVLVQRVWWQGSIPVGNI
jgi:hypothetical protein